MMHCRMVMLPTLIVLGVLTIVFAAIAIWLDSRAAKRNWSSRRPEPSHSERWTPASLIATAL